MNATTFNSLNSIIDDILLTYRDSKISESEDLSRIQVEQWIHQYRALLIKQDLDKGRDMNEQYLQTIAPLHISKLSNCVGGYHYKSDKEIPKFIDLHYGKGISAIKDLNGNLIQLGTETKAKYQSSRKYTCSDYIAYIQGNYLYILGPEHLEYVSIEGVLEDPTSIGECFDRDTSVYPIPANMIPTLKQMIFERELNIMLKVPSDITNNSTNDVTTEK